MGKRAVWKFPVPMPNRETNIATIPMPPGAEPLCVQFQGDQLCMWALIDPEEAKARKWYNFLIIGTGMEIDNSLFPYSYIATFQLAGGALVFHIFRID